MTVATNPGTPKSSRKRTPKSSRKRTPKSSRKRTPAGSARPVPSRSARARNVNRALRGSTQESDAVRDAHAIGAAKVLEIVAAAGYRDVRAGMAERAVRFQWVDMDEMETIFKAYEFGGSDLIVDLLNAVPQYRGTHLAGAELVGWAIGLGDYHLAVRLWAHEALRRTMRVTADVEYTLMTHPDIIGSTSLPNRLPVTRKVIDRILTDCPQAVGLLATKTSLNGPQTLRAVQVSPDDVFPSLLAADWSNWNVATYAAVSAMIRARELDLLLDGSRLPGAYLNCTQVDDDELITMLVGSDELQRRWIESGLRNKPTPELMEKLGLKEEQQRILQRVELGSLSWRCSSGPVNLVFPNIARIDLSYTPGLPLVMMTLAGRDSNELSAEARLLLKRLQHTAKRMFGDDEGLWELLKSEGGNESFLSMIRRARNGR
jgi:hypothetical protein